MRVIYKSKCPQCGTPNCYNTGFNLECVNIYCKFFSDIQHRLIQEEIIKIENYESELTGSKKIILDEEEEVEYHGYPGWFQPIKPFKN